MANGKQLAILLKGVDTWNEWRDEHPETHIDLTNAHLGERYLNGVNLDGADLNNAYMEGATLLNSTFRGANLWKAYLEGAYLRKADLCSVNLSEAYLRGADLVMANLTDANLSKAVLYGANLSGADLGGADLRECHLIGASLMQTSVHEAKISGSWVYGVNIWDLKGEFAEQTDLIISLDNPNLTVDNIKVAQFLHLILNNEEIQDALNTITSKSVLILGRFTIPKRKAVLDALRIKLREYNLLPIVFDFDRPTNRDFTETIKILAGLSFFVIVDVTNPRSTPLELQATIPDYQIPFVPIIQEGEEPFAMMADLRKYPWVLDTLSYNSVDMLVRSLKPAIIDPAIQKHNELQLIKARKPKIKSVKDFITDRGK
jgi:uncharacterized protein YjbI with pentapeptide repeats